MKHKINPTIDCVFKALLGSEKRKHLLIHFLNSVLECHEDPEKKVVDVRILNPYNEREFEDDKLGVVDVKAREASGRSFHVEIQAALHPGLKERMLYTWSAIYHSLLGKGEGYTLLKPVISVWIVTGVLFADTRLCHLRFRIGDPEAGLLFNDHFAMHVLQLPRWRMRKDRISEKDRWVYFFKEGRNIDVDDPPDILKNSKEMRDAMDVLEEFSENRENYLLYQSRLEGERVRQTILTELEKAIVARDKAEKASEKERVAREKAEKAREKIEREREKERVEKERERERAEKEIEKALKEIERLKKMLEK